MVLLGRICTDSYQQKFSFVIENAYESDYSKINEFGNINESGKISVVQDYPGVSRMTERIVRSPTLVTESPG